MSSFHQLILIIFTGGGVGENVTAVGCRPKTHTRAGLPLFKTVSGDRVMD